jgi:F-type H+-transporting ATPase subunit delta
MLINACFKLIFNTNKESKLSKNKIFSNTSAQRYSLALYELAIESNLLNKIEEQTSAILNLINSSKDFSNLIKNPTGNQDDLISVINKISENYNIENLLKNFITFLIKKRRFFYIKKILRNFTEICSKKRGELKAELKSAKELSSDEIKKITDELEKNFNSKMKLNYIHDKSLIGGLIVQIGSTMVDTSIKNKLQQIENRMIEA